MVQQRSGPIPIGNDELQLFEHMLNDKYVNLSLDLILKNLQIIRLIMPEDVGKCPGIRLKMGGWRAGEYGINLDNEGTIGEKVTKVIIVEGFMFKNQAFEYDGIIYKGVENGLPVILSILLRMISDNQKYSHSDMPDINFDMLTPISELWIANYNNNPDVMSFQLGIEAQFERVYTDVGV